MPFSPRELELLDQQTERRQKTADFFQAHPEYRRDLTPDNTALLEQAHEDAQTPRFAS